MRIHTDLITHNDLHQGIPPGVWLERSDTHGSRKRDHAFNVSLAGERAPGRTRKRNMQHIVNDPDDVVAATWDEWGIWIGHLFAIDPHAVIGNYDGVEDFHRQTDDRFRRHTWNLEHPATCTGCWAYDPEAHDLLT